MWLDNSSRDKTAQVTRQLAASVQTQTAHAQGVDNSGSNKMAVNDPNIDLFDAVRNGSLRGVDAALKAGADIDCEYASCEESNPGTLLFHASCSGHVDTARMLLRKGASLVKRSGRSAFAPLHAAAINGRTEVVDLLVQHGATVDIRDRCQNTPLMRACDHNHVDTVRRLLEIGARCDENEESWKLIEEARKTRLLRCCNPKCGKPGYSLRENRCSVEESYDLIEEARKSKLLRCCNPKCGKPGYRSALKLCVGCKLTRYCSRDCQKQHWSVGHKKCCGHDVYSYEQTDPYERIVMSLTKLALENE
ncbi:uncharacterized protein LOC144877119 [Branchiostoma floridae x Branchiostoma japonicum]